MITGIDLLELLQWPAMLVTVLAAWLIAAQSKRRREIGFWCFLLSNGLWLVWGWHDNAYGSRNSGWAMVSVLPTALV